MESKQHLQEGGVSVIQLPSPDSLSTASVKDYAASFSSEPPPAYHKPRSSAVQIARIVGVTVVVASAILGAFILAAAWINSRSSCAHHVIVPMPATHTQGHEHLPSFDRLVDPLQASEQKLEPTKVEDVNHNALDSADSVKATTTEGVKKVEEGGEEGAKEGGDGDEEEEEEEEEGSDQDTEEIPIQIRLPLQLDFDELAGMLMERNMRSRMNCVVEKRRAEEVVEHQPRTLQLPFGVNLTTDPRHERVSGERMAIFCESGNDQMHQQQRRPEMPFEFIPLMAQHAQSGPMVVPLPGPIHLPFQFAGPMQQPHHQPPHPQAPHLEEPHLQGTFPQPQQTVHIMGPIQQGPMHLQQGPMHLQHGPMHLQHGPMHLQQEILRRQMMEQEAMESMRPPPPPMPSPHQLPPQQGPLHHMPRMGPLPGHQGPIISVHHMVALSEGEPEEEVANQEGIPTGRAFRGPIPQRLPVHLPMHGNVRGPGILAPEQHRPHYVQPRSVPSDPFSGELHRRDKRVKKRCACDCAC